MRPSYDGVDKHPLESQTEPSQKGCAAYLCNSDNWKVRVLLLGLSMTLAYGVVIGSMKVKEHFFDHPKAPDMQTVEKAASVDTTHAKKIAELAKIHDKILQPKMMAVKKVQKVVKKVAAKKVAKQAIKASPKVHDNAIPRLRSAAKTVKMKHSIATADTKQKKVTVKKSTVKKSTVKKVAAKKVNMSITKKAKPHDHAVPHLRKRAAAKKTLKAKKAAQEEKVALKIEKLKAEKAAVEIEASGQHKVTKDLATPHSTRKVSKVRKAETREEEEIKKVERDALTEVRKRVEAAEEAEVASMNHAKEANSDDAAIKSLTKVLTNKDLEMVPVESFEQSVPLKIQQKGTAATQKGLTAIPTSKKGTAKKTVAAPKKIVGKENNKIDDEILAMETELLKDEALHPNDGTKDSIKKLLSSEVNHDEMDALSSAETELLGA